MSIIKTQHPITHVPKVTEDVIFPSGEIESDEPELESYLHLAQLMVLLNSLEWHWQSRQDFFAAGNLSIYYTPPGQNAPRVRGPDFFVAMNTECKPRKSWVVWQEGGKYPDAIVEVLSPSTAKTDRTKKKKIYQDTFGTANYFWFDPNPESLEFKGFHLVNGKYEEIQPNEQGLLWSESLGLYLGIYRQQLRWFTAEGELVLTPGESAAQERKAKEELQATNQELQEQLQQMEALLAEYREQLRDLSEDR